VRRARLFGVVGGSGTGKSDTPCARIVGLLSLNDGQIDSVWRRACVARRRAVSRAAPPMVSVSGMVRCFLTDCAARMSKRLCAAAETVRTCCARTLARDHKGCEMRSALPEDAMMKLPVRTVGRVMRKRAGFGARHRHGIPEICLSVP